jgi:hypothetical protein
LGIEGIVSLYLPWVRLLKRHLASSTTEAGWN